MKNIIITLFFLIFILATMKSRGNSTPVYDLNTPEVVANRTSADYTEVVEATFIDFRVFNPAISPDEAIVGETVSVFCNLRNPGGLAAGSSTFAFYISTNNSYSTDDILLKTVVVPSVGPTSQVPIDETIIIPNVAPGNYYILFRADINDTVDESNENNNVGNQPITISAASATCSDGVQNGDETGVDCGGSCPNSCSGGDVDLAFLSNSLSPSSTTPGGSITANCSIRNTGEDNAGSSILKLYFSEDLIYDASDIELGEDVIPALGPNEVDFSNVSLTIPANTSPGVYYIIFEADATDQIVETSESNNFFSSTITVTGIPDLDIVSTSTPLSAMPGEEITVGAGIINVGNADAGASTLEIYLSDDASYDTGDITLTQYPTPMLSPGSQDIVDINVTIPANTSPGAYYIIFAADATGQVVESNENNNFSSSSFTINGVPDLVVTNQSVSPDEVNAGGTVTLTSTVSNSGTGLAGTSSLAYYLSADSNFDAGDVELGQESIPSLDVGNSETINTSVVIPGGTAAGGYYILFMADYGGQVQESNENNNVVFESITISGLAGGGGDCDCLWVETETDNGTAIYYDDGNVGIGTQDPGTFKLAVEGDIGARRIKVTADAWADHVFDEDYALKSLSELQFYINENHHLPGVPSTAEAQADGVFVNDMHAILLEKVEELTLYILQQDERIKTLEQELSKSNSIISSETEK